MGEGFYQDFDRGDSISYFKKSGIGLQEEQLLGTGSLGGGGGEYVLFIMAYIERLHPKVQGFHQLKDKKGQGG